MSALWHSEPGTFWVGYTSQSDDDVLCKLPPSKGRGLDLNSTAIPRTFPDAWLWLDRPIHRGLLTIALACQVLPDKKRSKSHIADLHQISMEDQPASFTAER